MSHLFAHRVGAPRRSAPAPFTYLRSINDDVNSAPPENGRCQPGELLARFTLCHLDIDTSWDRWPL